MKVNTQIHRVYSLNPKGTIMDYDVRDYGIFTDIEYCQKYLNLYMLNYIYVKYILK